MLNNVNSTDLYGAIELGCRTMGSVFNKDDNDIPFMHTSLWPKARFGYSDKHAESHVPGRHLNALIAAERLVGISIDEEAIKKHAAAAYYSFSGPIPLPLNRLKEDDKLIGEPVFFVSHNIREGLHALYALSCFRNDARAHDMMKTAIDFISTHFIPQMAWDDTVAKNPDIVFLPEKFYIQGVARAIGPLVKYYRATAYKPALELACNLADEAIKHYPISGEFDQEIMNAVHVHSITCVLSSLAQLAKATNDGALMERVRRFYDNGLNHLRNELGWAVERLDREGMRRGEVNISGDIVETALILGETYGEYYYDDAERILRGHILPSQLRDISFSVPAENPDGLDRFQNVAERSIGAFGFPAPFGHQVNEKYSIGFNMDIVGGTVASLCEAYAACVSQEGGECRINLLFDIETEAIKVISPYPDGEMRITIKNPCDLSIRIPSWVNKELLMVEGAAWEINGERIYLQKPSVGQEIKILFPIEERDVVLHHSVCNLRAKMYGDIVRTMDNMGMDFTFFPPYKDQETRV